MKNGTDSAFSLSGKGIEMEIDGYGYDGMSKRLFISTQIAQGICVNAGRNGYNFLNPKQIAKTAYEITEELLKQEYERTKTTNSPTVD